MAKYVSKYLVEGGADVIQVIILLVFVVLFAILIYQIIKAPKDYYKKESELPLELDNEQKFNQS